ncbi:MAG: undecaprenyl-diphosphate phosphatase [Pseudomonadota bacterium]
MPLYQLVLLALIQGLTEFLPISSSGHLILLPELTSLEDQGALIDIAAHVGSLAAVLAYFRRDTVRLVVGGLQAAQLKFTDDSRMFLYIAGATVPVIAAAAVLVLFDATEAFRSAEVIAWATIIFAIPLFIADKYAPRLRQVEDMTWRRALLIGGAQLFAIVPGASRSGVTITAARALGFTRPEAARFSMLLAIPTISAFGLFSALELAGQGDVGRLSDAAIVAGLSFLSAYGAIFVFMKWLEKADMTLFVFYRLALGAGLLAIIYL